MVTHLPLEQVTQGSNPCSPARHNSAPCYDRYSTVPVFALKQNWAVDRCSLAPVQMKFYYVYILHNKNRNFLYIGFTENLRQRLKEHNSGKSKSTKPHIPLSLIFYEAYGNIKDAKRREL